MDWKKIGKKLLFPPLWLLLLLTAFSAWGLATVFLRGLETAPVAYGVYVTAFYTLCAAVAACIWVLPKRYEAVKAKILAHPLAYRYVSDSVFRAKVSLQASLGINLAYVAMNVLLWYRQRSWWFVCLGVYYGILSGMRFVLVRYVRLNPIGADRQGELKRALACSYIMLLLNFFLTGAVMMVVYQGRGFSYPGVLIYVVALYTFYTAVHAIISMVRYRRFESPVMSTAKGISMAAALVSMLNLETAMFAQFGQTMAIGDQQLMIMLTGGGISMAVIAIAVHTIVRATKELQKMRYSQNG